MKPRKYVFIMFLVCFAGILFANTEPVVSNVNAAQRTDGSKLVDIYYTVTDADNDTLSVSIAISADNGASFCINPMPGNLSGDIGDGIVSGTNKHIVWNAGAAGNVYDGNQFRVKVMATELADLTTGLVAYYPFNGNANDESANANNGIVVGPVLSMDRFGNNNSSYWFDGVDDYVIVSNNPSMNLTTTATFSVWFNIANDINYHVTEEAPHVFSKGATYGVLWPDYSFETGETASYIEMTNSANVGNTYNLPVMQQSEWIHIVLVFDSGTLKVFKNNDLISQQNILNSFRLSPEPLYIGIRFSQYHHAPFKGFIDDFRIYNRALSANEVQTLYQEGGWPNLNQGLVAYYPFNGNANDESGNGHDCVVVGATLTDDRFGNPNKAYNFDGFSNYLDVGDWSMGGAFTISAWALNRSYPFCSRVIDFGNGPEAQNIIIATNGGTPGLWFRVQQNAYNEPNCSGIDYPDYFTTNQWDFVTCSLSSTGSMRIYRNGILLAETQNAYVPPVTMRTQSYIGRSNWWWDGYFDGIMDDFRVYNRALSLTEIQALYHEGGWPITKRTE